MADYSPFTSFCFRVQFEGVSSDTDDLLFQSVSGLSTSIETETIREGGENRFSHVLPSRTQYSDLVLKRGALKDSSVISWCRDAIENFIFSPTTVNVYLLDTNHEPLIAWNLVHAWPKKWSVSDLNSEQSSLLIETLELQYNFFTVNHSATS